MKKFFLVSGYSIFLFFPSTFKFSNSQNDFSGPWYGKKNIISCGKALSSAKTTLNGSAGEIAINDNRNPAGEMRNGILYLRLEARTGTWYPETHDGNGLRVHAFAEADKPLQLPGPLIRVPEGTIINAEIKNTIPGSPLVLRGFHTHNANSGDSVSIPFNKKYKVQFKAGKAGTYFYWASDGTLKTGSPGLPFFEDSQLFGAFIVDPPNTKPDPEERILMVSIWNDTINSQATFDREELALNGLTWPYTERLSYPKDRPVHWRLINASNQVHPMHLHGFYFSVNSRGNGNSDNVFKEKDRYLAVTELMLPHETLSVTWTPEREGNWLFHCHTLVHMMAGSFLRETAEMTEQQMNDITTHARNGMGGLIMGINITPSLEKISTKPELKSTERSITMILQEKKNWYDTLTGYGFVIREGNILTDAKESIPGPPLILERGKPVSIKIINHLPEATTVHWHGLEIESYFDGVAGWGNRGSELAPMIMPGDSFIVHLTPPRAGTFIYHTHMHTMQLLKGMYGALIVKEPGEKFSNVREKIFVIGQGGTNIVPSLFFLNGKMNIDTVTLQRGMNYRFRIINITALGPDLNVSLLLNGLPFKWREMARDGAELAVNQQTQKLAADQSVTIGQTMDFQFNPEKPGNYLFAVKNYEGTIVLSKSFQVH
ncbi:multicopper oxidase domain-containing protein [Flavihumibacter profundi]|uniref:multicopper oxidase domain-containing protein n=1 Tax=Flavihumibacter profundi TaxID=2716883 RepID=UPI001CC40FB0|nr:multicopper oxidase domain-containing protein [Flavihumibacter profundi]MBZ5856807.1 multicopper oxidase domain-containing protein [Flavihumibacter profundi]